MSHTMSEKTGVKKSSSIEKFTPRNRRQLSKRDLQKLHPLERSRYLAYEDPPKGISKSMLESKKRLHESMKTFNKATVLITKEEQFEKFRHEQLIGQLKAAEARDRVRLLRLRYQKNKAEEVNHLISCQPTAIKAVRLQTLLPPIASKITVRDILDKDERFRVEALLEDPTGIETERKLS